MPLHLNSLSGKACCIHLLFYSTLLSFLFRILFLISLFLNVFHLPIFSILQLNFIINHYLFHLYFHYYFKFYLFSTTVLKSIFCIIFQYFFNLLFSIQFKFLEIRQQPILFNLKVFTILNDNHLIFFEFLDRRLYSFFLLKLNFKIFLELQFHHFTFKKYYRFLIDYLILQ